MPRRARMYIPDLPYHIVHRGNNREACFVGSDDYQFYLELWKECSKRYGVSVHAYCLMTNRLKVPRLKVTLKVTEGLKFDQSVWIKGAGGIKK